MISSLPISKDLLTILKTKAQLNELLNIPILSQSKKLIFIS